MNIAILGWGSVVWNPGSLEYRGFWNPSKLQLPVEFSRRSRDGRLTLVLDFENGSHCPMYVARSARSDLNDAIADLRDREQTIWGRIGWYCKINNSGSTTRTNDTEAEQNAHKKARPLVEAWIKDQEHDAVVWTALASNYKKQLEVNYTKEHALDYLKRLEKRQRRVAHDYIARAPKEIQTDLRTAWIAANK